MSERNTIGKYQIQHPPHVRHCKIPRPTSPTIPLIFAKKAEEAQIRTSVEAVESVESKKDGQKNRTKKGSLLIVVSHLWFVLRGEESEIVYVNYPSLLPGNITPSTVLAKIGRQSWSERGTTSHW